MRIVAGSLKGRSIVAPEGQGTRPTSDRARQAVFNVLEHAAWAEPLAGARVLDLFAGSGALGFEAISRGAAFCLFVETDDAARGAIRENVDAFSLFGQTRSIGAVPPTWAPARAPRVNRSTSPSSIRPTARVWRTRRWLRCATAAG